MNKSKQLTSLFLALLFVKAFSLSGAVFELDFTALDNKNARIYGSVVDTVFDTPDVAGISISAADSFIVELNYGSQISAFLKLQVGANGRITSVQWKDADGSQTSGLFVSLPTSFYTLENNTKRLVLHGMDVHLDFQQIDLTQYEFPQAGTSTPDSTGGHPYQLFPGDYLLVLGDEVIGLGVANLELELLAATEEWNSTIAWTPYYEPGTASSPISLPGAYYDIDTTYLEFKGKKLYLEVDADNDYLYLVQAGVNFEDGDSVSIFPGTYDLQSGQGIGRSANFVLVLDASTHALRDTVWMTDNDSSMTGAGLPLPSAILTMVLDTVFVKGGSVAVNLEEPDLLIAMANTPAGTGQSGWQTLKLLPGDYLIDDPDDNFGIVAEIGLNGIWNNRVYYLPNGEEPTLENLLHGRCFTRREDSLNIHGMVVSFHTDSIDTLDFKVAALESGKGAIPDSAEFRLLPGDYLITGTSIATSDTSLLITFEFSNAKGGLVSRAEWKDVIGGTTGGLFELYPPEDILIRHGSMTIFMVPGGPKTKFTQDYAVPGRSPSGAWYQLADSLLRFKYEGEYDPGTLQAQVIDWQRNVVLSPSTLSLPKVYGDNRLMINCGGLTAGHYTLELTNEKNETFYVRFEKN